MMPNLVDLERALAAILTSLRSYLPDVVVIGGWVPHLYKRFGGFPNWGGELSLTGEVDALVTPALKADHRPLVPQILAAAGYQPVGGDDTAAVWANNPATGEKVEFLVNHTGPYSGVGQVQAISEQPGLGALSLEGLGILREYTNTLKVPNSSGEQLDVRVPRLGAYVVNKGFTFARRLQHPHQRNPKRPKDLLYIRDVMAAGEGVVDRIAADVEEIVRGGGRSKDDVHKATSHLGLLVGGAWPEETAEAAAMLVERTPTLSKEAAAADIRGHLSDLVEVLKEHGG